MWMAAQLWKFMRVRKRFWLAPVIIVMLLLGGLLVLAQAPSWRPLSTRSSEAEQHADPGDLGVLPRQRGRNRARRRGGRSGTRGALHPQETRREVSPQRRRLLPARGREKPRSTRICRFLRQAFAQVRASARNLPCVCAERLSLLPDGDSGLVAGETLPAGPAGPGAQALLQGLRARQSAAVLRASPEPRRERVFPVAVPGSGGADRGRRGRVGHHVARRRSR